MRGRAVDKFGRFVSSLSAIGITLGVAALITVTSVMNGFERSLQDSILAYMPQAILTSSTGNIDPNQHPITDLKNLHGVKNRADCSIGSGFAKPNERRGGDDERNSF